METTKEEKEEASHGEQNSNSLLCFSVLHLPSFFLLYWIQTFMGAVWTTGAGAGVGVAAGADCERRSAASAAMASWVENTRGLTGPVCFFSSRASAASAAADYPDEEEERKKGGMEEKLETGIKYAGSAS